MDKLAYFHTELIGTTRIGDYSDFTARMGDFVTVLEEFTRSERLSAKRKFSNNFNLAFRSL